MTFEEDSRTVRWFLIGVVVVSLPLGIHWISVGKHAIAMADLGLACIALIAYGAVLWAGQDG